MTSYTFLKTSAFGALAAALVLTALPAEAQDRGRRGDWSERAGREDRAQSPRQARPADAARSGWGAAREQRQTARSQDDGQRPAPQAQAAPPSGGSGYTYQRGASRGGAMATEQRGGYGAAVRGERRGDYGAAARGDYGATTRAERREDGRESRQDFRQGYRAGQVADGRSDRDAYRQGYRSGQREDWRDDRRDNRQSYARGYRDGDRSDNRYGRDFRRWDNRGWRNDNRYDWHRYRSANRSIFSIGRYYAPYRSYSYSRLNIGFRLGSLFYSNRYWINDPWHYRLPPAYGPYRWVRYYDDALLVDIYTGEVVDVIHNLFW